MIKKRKFVTLLYVFILTVLPQLIVLALLGSVCYFAYWFGVHNSTVHAIVGVVAFIAMLFAFLGIAIFTKNYGLSIFAPTRMDFDIEQYKGDPIIKIDYSYGRRNVITGERSINFNVREESYDGRFFLAFLMSIVIGLTGIFKFIIEGLRVCLSDARQAEWDECRDNLTISMMGEKKKFFIIPAIFVIVFIVSWIICLSAQDVSKEKYNPNHIEFEITEKHNSENNNSRIHILFYGTVTNNGNAKLELIKGSVYFKDRDGNILCTDENVVIYSVHDDYLDKNESWEVELWALSNPNDSGAQRIWDSDLNDIEIIMEISEIHYKGKKIDFPNDDYDDYLVVKPIK